jgi:phosphoglycolate phosphatase
MKQAVIFDLDGTLADTIDDIAAAVNRALARRGLPEHDRELYKLMVGNGFRQLIVRALPESLRSNEAYLEATRAEAAADYAGRCLERTRAYPGVRELLSALTSKGLDLAVLSNKPDELTRKCVAGLFPSIHFAIVRGETEAFPRKPDPASALDACSRMGATPAGVSPAEVLYLGDTGVDMQTAKAAGFTALGALWGFRSEEELRESGADALLASPLDLLKYL